MASRKGYGLAVMEMDKVPEGYFRKKREQIYGIMGMGEMFGKPVPVMVFITPNDREKAFIELNKGIKNPEYYVVKKINEPILFDDKKA